MLKPLIRQSIKTCCECNGVLSGRADKRFCDDNCRTSFNNRLKCDETNFVRNVNNLLRRNRRILRYFLSLNNPKIKRYQLVEAGFLFGYLTRTSPVGKEIYYFVYEYGYLILPDEEILLVKTDDPPIAIQ